MQGCITERFMSIVRSMKFNYRLTTIEEPHSSCNQSTISLLQVKTYHARREQLVTCVVLLRRLRYSSAPQLVVPVYNHIKNDIYTSELW
jgi:hypothetical protein